MLRRIVFDECPYFRFQYLFGNGEEGAGYFTAVLLKRSTVYRDSIQVIEFPDTVMGRDLTLVEADIADNKFLFINTHLESTKVET